MWRAKFKVCWQTRSKRVLFGLGLSYCDLLFVFPHFRNLCTSHNATLPPLQKPVVPRPTQKWKSLALQTAPDRFDGLTQEAQMTRDSPSLVMQHRLTQPCWLTSHRGEWHFGIEGKLPYSLVAFVFSNFELHRVLYRLNEISSKSIHFKWLCSLKIILETVLCNVMKWQ